MTSFDGVTNRAFSEAFAATWLPRRPLASDTKTGGYTRMSRPEALKRAYIEANPLVMQSLVVTDRDRSEADRAWEAAGLPAPSYTALNPHTTTGHIVYALETPVCLTDSARRRPINLLARIEHGLNTVLQGDASYSGRITKNPLNAQHVLDLWGDGEHVVRYGLKELAAALDEIRALPTAGQPRKHVTTSAVGRNCALFDLTRAWSYRAIRGYWTATAEEWEQAVFRNAWHSNETLIGNEFTAGPLGYVEVTHLARSIARWTRRNFSPEKFTERQKALGQRGGAAARNQAVVAPLGAKMTAEKRRADRANRLQRMLEVY